VSSSKPFIVRSFLRYQVKRNEGPNGNCCRNSGIDVIEYCSVISTKLRCRLNLLLTFDGTYQRQQIACLGSALQNSTCSATDQACICADAALNAKVSICVQSSCNVKEQLSKGPPIILGFLSLTKTLATINLGSITCSAPVRNKAEVYRNLGIIFYTLSTISVALRFIARFIKGMSIWYDDWLMVLILVCIFLLHLVIYN
jgi:hypothetical protein